MAEFKAASSGKGISHPTPNPQLALLALTGPN